MYEVFFYASRLVIAGLESGEFLNKGGIFQYVETKETVGFHVEKFLSGKYPSIVLLGDPDIIWSWFRSYFREIPAAGGIVRSDSGYLFIFRRGKWDLPKGKVETGESNEKAAVREVCEETGLQYAEIICELPSTWHVYHNTFVNDKEEYVLKKTSWYLMESSDKQDLVPESGEDIEHAKWISPENLKIVEENTFTNLLPLIKMLKQHKG